MENNNLSSDLIKLHLRTMGDARVPTVNARQLHSFLEVGKHFASWIQDRIASFGFVEGQDFVIADGLIFPDSGKSAAGRQLKEYFLTIDMAKELSMVERNEKGKQARRYFIECERRMIDSAPAPMTREQLLARAVLESQEVIAEKDAAIGKLTADNAELQEDRNVLRKIAVADGSLCITDAAKTLQVSRDLLFRIMRERQWIYKRQGTKNYIAYQTMINSNRLEHKASTILRPDGTERIVSDVRVTPRGIVDLAKIVANYDPFEF
jgi:anti-repressor protein